MFVIRSTLEESQVRELEELQFLAVSRALCLYASSGLVIESDDVRGLDLRIGSPWGFDHEFRKLSARTSTSLKLSRAELGGHLAWAIYN